MLCFLNNFVNHNNKETPSTFPENWREIDQPFFSLVGDILDGKGATKIVDPGSLVPDPDFWAKREPEDTVKSRVLEKYGRPEQAWPGGIPEEIIIATGSTRKALMMSVVLNNIDLPFDHPMDYQEFV